MSQQGTGSSFGSNNPYRKTSGSRTPPEKTGASSSVRRISQNRSPREAFPNYRAEAFQDYATPRSRSGSSSNRYPPPAYDQSASPKGESRHRRRTSSLSARYPGDKSHQPLEILRKDSKKAYRSPHLKKTHLPGPDTIDQLDPAIGGRAYHHEGPYDAALLARNNSVGISPVAALQSTNAEALKATPAENVRDSVERHKPLDGVAQLPSGVPDRFGRTLHYEEGADLMHEDGPDGPGYKRWAGKVRSKKRPIRAMANSPQDYAPGDLKGKGDTFLLDQALQAHTINENGIEMSETAFKNAKANGTLDNRDPVTIAGGEAAYADYARANDVDVARNRSDSGGLRSGLKKRIGSLRRKNREDN